MTGELAGSAWPEIGHPIVLVPLGSTEQHGPHLPLDTDAAVATAVASAVAKSLRARGADAQVAPPIAYGSSGEHQDFPGTISIGQHALTLLLLELGRSASQWAGRIVFVNAHGGNIGALWDAVTVLIGESRPVSWVPCATVSVDVPSADAHAGRTETGLMEAIRPGSVRRERVEPGNDTPVTELLPRLKEHGVRAVSANGILGDPRGATRDEGEALLRAVVDDVRRRIEHDTPDSRGMLTLPPPAEERPR